MKICIISGSRSEFDLLRNLIVEIKKIDFLIQNYWLPGLTYQSFLVIYRVYKKTKIKINYKVNISIKGDSTKQISNFLALV